MRSLTVNLFTTLRDTCTTYYLKYQVCCHHLWALSVSNSWTQHCLNNIALRVAAIKLLIKVQCQDIDPLLTALLSTIVRISEILYSHDSHRTSNTILRLYNLTWYHHEPCCYFLSNPRLQTRSHLFGIYLHDVVVHAPTIYQQVCLRSTNAESQERLFSQAKHIGLKATTSWKVENVLPTILVCMQARQM